MTAEQDRRDRSFEIRVAAAEQAKNVTYNYRAIDPIKGQELPQPVIHRANGEENLMGIPLSFTKGLPHNKKSGLAESRADFDQMVEGIDSGRGIDYRRTPLGPAADINNPQAPTREKDWASQRGRDLLAAVRATNKSGDIVRAWEASSAGLAFEINGPDAQAVTMPPAPALGSDELTAEIAEVYLQAAARDVPFAKFKNNKVIEHAVKNLNKLPYFQNFQRQFVDAPGNVPITTDNIFRGVFRGDLIGPYLSQFMLIGNNGLNTNRSRPEFSVDDGFIAYGSISIDQRIRIAVPGVNYMTSFEEWLDVQNGADFRGEELYQDNPKRRFITTPRDLATYVHYDALYEAYLNACLILLGAGAAFDPGVPFQQPDNVDHQQGFALFGGPHILTLVTEVATRALKAVRYQKFNVHRRCRPEVLAARMERLKQIRKGVDSTTFARFEQMDRDLENAGVYDTLNSVSPDSGKLLPMAFVEGSPMHPAYGAGHATVAGACTTILKAWFDTTLKFDYFKGNFNQGPEPTFVRFVREPANPMVAFEPAGNKLKLVKTNGDLTVEGELNKIAANISIGRDWAGVHYYTDYTQSMIMGEEIAIKMLQEQSITYNDEDNLSFTLFKFDGSVIRIENGQIIPVAN